MLQVPELKSPLFVLACMMTSILNSLEQQLPRSSHGFNVMFHDLIKNFNNDYTIEL